MTIDWGILQFKRKIIDNARYIFDNYIDTSKGLDALYSRPEVSTDKTICYKNFDVIRLTGTTSGQHKIAWKIDDATNVNKLYVRAKVNVVNKEDGSLIITDSRLSNGILFMIAPVLSNEDFRIYLKRGSLYPVIYREPVDLSYDQYYTIEGMIDFINNTISVARDNVEKAVLTSETFPSFDDVYVGFRAAYSQDIPNMIAKDVFITWE